MGKLSIVFLLGLLVAVLAISSLFIRREAFEDATGADSTLLGPGGTQQESSSDSGLLGPGGTQQEDDTGLLGPGGMQQQQPPSACTQTANEKGSRAALLRDIQQTIHNELASFKGMTTASSQPLFQAESSNNVLMSEDPSLQQGAEMKASRPTYCPKDMSQYIRKDQIPCWGCSLDY